MRTGFMLSGVIFIVPTGESPLKTSSIDAAVPRDLRELYILADRLYFPFRQNPTEAVRLVIAG